MIQGRSFGREFVPFWGIGKSFIQLASRIKKRGLNRLLSILHGCIIKNEKAGDLVPVNWIKKNLGMVLISFDMMKIK